MPIVYTGTVGDKGIVEITANPPNLSTWKKVKIQCKVLKRNFNDRFFQSIVGPWKNTLLLLPHHPMSEWGWNRYCFKHFKWARLMKLGAIDIGTMLFPPLGLVFLLFSRLRADRIGVSGSEYSHINCAEDEMWFFINGVGVTSELQQANGAQLSDIFHREIFLVRNPTQGILIDLIECAVGRTFDKLTGVARKTAETLHRSLVANPTKRMIVLAHSQGGIIISGAIEHLIKTNRIEGLDRVEIYDFGSGATEYFQVEDPVTQKRYPYYEHFANLRDYTAKIGVLRLKGEIPVYTTNNLGHLLGEYYLPDVVCHNYKADGPEPKLYEYLQPNFNHYNIAYPDPAQAVQCSKGQIITCEEVCKDGVKTRFKSRKRFNHDQSTQSQTKSQYNYYDPITQNQYNCQYQYSCGPASV